MPNLKAIPGYVYILAGILIAFLLGIVIAKLAEFFRELRYINKEISCTGGAERKHWLRQRRRLWLSLLPFFKY